MTSHDSAMVTKSHSSDMDIIFKQVLIEMYCSATKCVLLHLVFYIPLIPAIWGHHQKSVHTLDRAQ